MAFIYADNSYGRAPIEVGRAYAKEIGVDLVDEQIVPTSFTDATSQLLTMKGKDPDFAYINTNTQWVPVILKDSHKLGLKTKYFINNYGIDERTPKLAGDAAEGVLGIQDVAYWGENVPGMKTLMEVHNRLHPGETPNSPYMRGWLWVILTVEALEARGPERRRRGDQEGLRELEGAGHVGDHPAVHLHERGPSADHPRPHRAGQGRQGRAAPRGVGGPRHEVDRQVTEPC